MDPSGQPNAAMEELAMRNKPYTYLRTDVQKPHLLLESALFPETPPPDVNDLAENNALWRRVFPRTKSVSRSSSGVRPQAPLPPVRPFKDLGRLTYLDLLSRAGSYPSRNRVGSTPAPKKHSESRAQWKSRKSTPDSETSKRNAKDKRPAKVKAVVKDEEKSEDALDDDDDDDDEDDEEEVPRPQRLRPRRRSPGTDTRTGSWLKQSGWAIPVCVVVGVTLLIAAFIVIMTVQIGSVKPTPIPHKGNTTKSKTKKSAQDTTQVTSPKKPQARVERDPTPQQEPYGSLGITDYEETQLDSPTPSIFQCSTDACHWQRRLVDDKLNLTVDPCKDFYAYVCSAAWDFHGALPYRAAGQTYIITEVLKFIRKHGHGVQAASSSQSRLSFLDHSNMLLASCLNTSNAQGLSQWDPIRGLLRKVGLDGWPYVDQPPPPFHLDDVLKLVDHRLAIFALMRVFLRKATEDGTYVPHVDAPNNFLLVRYELLKMSQGVPYKNIVRKVLTLWKSLPRGNSLAHDVVRLEQALFDASQTSRKPVWRGDTIVLVEKLPKLPRLHLDTYLLYLRPNSKEAVFLNQDYVVKLSVLLQKFQPRTFLNLLGVWVVVLASPFLPQSSLPRELLNMSHPNHQAHLDPREQSCFHLVARLFPHGVRWILRSILTNTTNPERQWETMTAAVVSVLANSFQQGTSWMEKSEAAAAVKRLKSLQVNYLEGREPLEQIASYYPTIDVTFQPSTSLKDYSDLLERTLHKYWESEEGSDLDARYYESFSTSDQECNWERSPESPNNIYLASSSLASAALVTRSAVPSALLPLMASDLARALFLTALHRASWTTGTQDRFRELQVCLLERYKRGRRRNARDFLMVALSDNAVLEPLATAFKELGYGVQFVPGDRGGNLTLTRMFFANFAAGFCVPGEEARQGEDRMKWRLGLPARLRVNMAVSDSPEFQRAFQCPKRGTAPRCPIWGHRSAVKVTARSAPSNDDH